MYTWSLLSLNCKTVIDGFYLMLSERFVQATKAFHYISRTKIWVRRQLFVSPMCYCYPFVAVIVFVEFVSMSFPGCSSRSRGQVLYRRPPSSLATLVRRITWLTSERTIWLVVKRARGSLKSRSHLTTNFNALSMFKISMSVDEFYTFVERQLPITHLRLTVQMRVEQNYHPN